MPLMQRDDGLFLAVLVVPLVEGFTFLLRLKRLLPNKIKHLDSFYVSYFVLNILTQVFVVGVARSENFFQLSFL